MAKFKSTLVGSRFNKGALAFIRSDELRPGDLLTLVREPDNVFDCNAILVFKMRHNLKLGHVVAEDAWTLAPLMDAGIPLEARWGGDFILDINWNDGIARKKQGQLKLSKRNRYLAMQQRRQSEMIDGMWGLQGALSPSEDDEIPF